MRPRSEIRQAIRHAAQAFGAAGATWRDMAQQACVGMDAARLTVKNMATAGELLRVGEVRVDGARRPMTLFVPAPPEAQSAGADLELAIRGWADFR